MTIDRITTLRKFIEKDPHDWLSLFLLGLEFMKETNYAAAADAFGRAETMTERVSAPQAASTGDNAFALHMYALCMAGECDRVQALIREPWLQSLRDRGVRPETMANSPLPPFWTWMKEIFGIDPRLPDTESWP